MELATAQENATARGWQIFMLTFTVQHESAQALTELIGLLKDAYTDFRNGKQWDKLKARLKIEGTVQGKEITHGANGWHPHLHVLFFSSMPALPVDEAADFLKKRWQRMVIKHGGYCTYENGLKVSVSTDSALALYPDKDDLSEIVTDDTPSFTGKKSWTIASELAKSSAKLGKDGGRTPLQLVIAAMTGDTQAGTLWWEYFDAMKGQRQLWWSQGLKEKLGITDDLTDEDIAHAALDDELEFMLLSDEILAAINKHERGQNARGVLLEIASAGKVDQVWHFLTGLGVQRPDDEITYRRLHVDVDALTVEDRGEVSGAAARELLAHDRWSFMAGGDDNAPQN